MRCRRDRIRDDATSVLVWLSFLFFPPIRLIISETYHTPQLALPLPLPNLANPRLLFIHHPRIRETGCYIAACHYSRPGLSVDNPWVRVFHTVEFYRSIRFLPDGKALTFLTTDPPRDTVGRMYAGNGDKGFAVGRWRVEMSDGIEGAQRGSLEEDLEGEKEKRRRRGGARVIIEDLKGECAQTSGEDTSRKANIAEPAYPPFPLCIYRSTHGQVCLPHGPLATLH